MKIKERGLRLGVAFAVVTLVSSQIPLRGQVALGSNASFYSASQPADGYLSGGSDNSGSFLGITSLTNRDAISGLVVGMLGLGVYSTLSDARGRVGAPKAAAQAQAKPIYDVLSDLPMDFSELVTLIDAAEFVNTLRGDGAYTFFAPSNAGLRALGAAAQENLKDPARKAALVQLLKTHTVVGRYTVSALRSLPTGSTLETLSGEKLAVRATSEGIFVEGVRITETDIVASNGWIHPIERFFER